ncbi:heme peroxidase [Gymnopus androsaceus JB14]|uniref:Peroxidase n=1 Tax=Gymnopus androsaceus JB14 TaxID=1447944 RepID=A0A6A4H7J3_9AGAR|nr:heme peroxidase [Gymnopus androsaceus JB14]
MSLPLLKSFFIAGIFGYVHGFSTFQWPNPVLSHVDQLFFEDDMGGFIQGCPIRDNTTIAAQWLRIAYHDSASHNVSEGTGGVDASIQYELDRLENIGEGMTASLRDFNGFGTTPFFGMADMIALAAVLAVEGCGGPIIPYSAGRVDATVAGPSTVPQPQQPLASHIASFQSQGFNESEMISLVSCGHTFGGVRQGDFPLIVTESLGATDVATFDTTPAFDNTIVSEYLMNTTKDVLVVGPNITTRSDFRIFSSDGNATMQNLLSPDTFSETCANLIERMINNVPNGVNLTEPITEPFDYLISDPLLSYQNGTLIMTTTLRVLNPSTGATVTMLWADRQGSFCPSTGCSVQSSGSQNVVFNAGPTTQNLAAARYSFNATINATSSISKFWFEIDNNDGSDSIVVDNGGSGFVVEQDSLFVDVIRSKELFVVTPTSFNMVYDIVVAVRGDAGSISTSMTAFSGTSLASAPPFTPVITPTTLQLDGNNPPEGGFTFYNANFTLLSVTYLSMAATVAGTTYTQENFDLTAVTFDIVDVGF